MSARRNFVVNGCNVTSTTLSKIQNGDGVPENQEQSCGHTITSPHLHFQAGLQFALTSAGGYQGH